MKKWDVTVKFTIQSETRKEAWDIGKRICEEKLRDLAYVHSVSMEPLPDPEEWIAVNEPIRPQIILY